MAVPIRSSGERIELGEPTTLFQARVGDIALLQSGYNLSYVAVPDGQRLLLIKPETTTAQSTDVRAIVNRADELARKAPLLKRAC
jgi:hypothetical protein